MEVFSDMTPGPTSNNIKYGSEGNLEFTSDRAELHTTFSQGSDFENRNLSELGIAILCAAPNNWRSFQYAKGMEIVFCWRHVFEIFKARVIALSIFVIDLFATRRLTKKCASNELMDKKLSSMTTDRKSDARIAIARNLWLQYFQLASPRWQNAPNVTDATYFVNSIPVWYGLPYLRHGGTLPCR